MRAADAFRYQGGPGASSLFGLLVELGPLMLNDQSLDNPEYKKTGIPQLVRNPASWSAKANLIVVSTALHCTALHSTALHRNHLLCSVYVSTPAAVASVL
jgi:hypothetical protein